MRRKDGTSRTEIGRERQSSNKSKMTKVGRDLEVASNKERQNNVETQPYSCTRVLRGSGSTPKENNEDISKARGESGVPIHQLP